MGTVRGVFFHPTRGIENVVIRPYLRVGPWRLSCDVSRQRCLRRWIFRFYVESRVTGLVRFARELVWD